MILEICLLLILLMIIYIFWNQDPADYPPGPFRIPIIGGGRPNSDERCLQMQKKYGDLFMEKVGKFYWLTICDYQLAKEALSKSILSDRPSVDAIKELNGGTMAGIISSNGEHWKSNRKFSINYLKQRGMGKSCLEESIQQEAKEIVAELSRLSGSTANLTFLNFAPLNVIWNMIASKRYAPGDPMLDNIQQLNKEYMDSFGAMFHMEFFPLLPKIVPSFLAKYIFNREGYIKYTVAMKDITQPIIMEHKKNLDRNQPKDLIDEYYLEQEKPQQLIAECISDHDLRSITMDLFHAGSDTVSLTLQWAILYLAKNPKIQAKMQEEIDSVVPRNTLPGYEHRNQLPYCEAVIHETLRQSSLSNFGVLRINSEEFHLGGYRIPKGTYITPAIDFILHDTKYWTNPQEFNPNRFIDEDGKFFCPKEGFMPFGIGKRICPGEVMARAELYIFLTAIFQKFSFSAPKGKVFDLGYQSTSYGLHMPRCREVLIIPRN